MKKTRSYKDTREYFDEYQNQWDMAKQCCNEFRSPIYRENAKFAIPEGAIPYIFVCDFMSGRYDVRLCDSFDDFYTNKSLESYPVLVHYKTFSDFFDDEWRIG